jgi:hypothetical protein
VVTQVRRDCQCTIESSYTVGIAAKGSNVKDDCQCHCQCSVQTKIELTV